MEAFPYPYNTHEVTFTHICFTRFWSPCIYFEDFPDTTSLPPSPPTSPESPERWIKSVFANHVVCRLFPALMTSSPVWWRHSLSQHRSHAGCAWVQTPAISIISTADLRRKSCMLIGLYRSRDDAIWLVMPQTAPLYYWRSFIKSMRMLPSQSWTRACTEKDEERRSWVGSVREGGHVTPSFLTGDAKEFQSNIDFR